MESRRFGGPVTDGQILQEQLAAARMVEDTIGTRTVDAQRAGAGTDDGEAVEKHGDGAVTERDRAAFHVTQIDRVAFARGGNGTAQSRSAIAVCTTRHRPDGRRDFRHGVGRHLRLQLLAQCDRAGVRHRSPVCCR
jgi:hypothetical protein